MPHVSTPGRAVSRTTVALLIAALLLLALAWGLWRWSHPAVASYAPAPIKVAIAPVSDAPFTRYLEAIGELEAVQQVSVPAEVGGRVVQLPVESGQRVERDQVLVKLNDAPQRGSLMRLQSELENAKVKLERSRSLVKVSAISHEAFDNAQTEYTTAQGALQELKAQIDQLTIRAPFAGTLGIRKVHLGQYVNPGDSLINLVGDQGLYVNFSVPEQALAQLKVGNRVNVQLDALPGQHYTARISSIDPFLDRARTLSVQALLQAPTPGALPRMFAKVRLPQPLPSSTLTVPETAITYNAYGEDVFVVQPSPDANTPPVARRVLVKTGERRDGRVVIDSGLNPGEQVVISGQIKLSDGAAIEPLERTVLNDANTPARLSMSGEQP
ncbi:efflux RND transporter periplasmic adaptor subunit [Pseudomonas sp. TH34]|uniref:efflux RND transporter periplasmic adaptor subunit n=1 Tax=Pseudomonas TaxID=286 RepID=UPI0007A3C7DF|nr:MULTISPECIES: efflux RND transporter periplasmic adaptor subunit [Pseudomonas]AMW86110.1 putative Co/Zn/Cd efflux system membrane fusion protein [Pseudomonas yamanorum]MBK5412694.1 efflux RND transporter periplasmic adaptor subunit [Pseudomonas sp. TH34]NVZ87467.1 efflux RND transporter periplasmic adaptor subunit [Pseudomonas yamanorum]SDU15202.1 membrane fusion protein, multidrug efflux system [Pseudomonas yamanorum]